MGRNYKNNDETITFSYHETELTVFDKVEIEYFSKYKKYFQNQLLKKPYTSV